MSLHTPAPRRLTVPQFAARKGGQKLAMLTAYTTPVARILDPHVDALLVGDSVGMVMYGMDDTLAVTVDMLINHGKAVMRGSQQALVVVDMPFGSYHESPAQAMRNAARILSETGAAAVKLEGGLEMADTIEFLEARGVPVMAHIGLMPQHRNRIGGFVSQGKTEAAADRIRADALGVANAGAFAIVIEGTAEPLARQITADVGVPTIGIGASPACDGQVLVVDDILGMLGDFQPRFVKRYASVGDTISEAAARYVSEVRNGTFPQAEHCFGVNVNKG